MDGSKGRRLFSKLGLLLLFTQSYLYVPLASGHRQAGVSLVFLGVTLPNDSFVDFDDVLNIGSIGSNIPSNRNPSDRALQCITDLVDCCGTESGTVRAEHGDWYFPDGTRIRDFDPSYSTRFLINRGPNEVIGEQQFYGSVRLFRRWSYVPERGRFRCELPSTSNPSINQNIYVNILNFGLHFNFDHVTISPSTGSTATTAGQRDYSLICSATLFDPHRLPSGVPSPNFQWFFIGSTSLPSGVTAMTTVMSSSNTTSETYTSILQFPPLSQCHIGNYTCRLGPGRLMNSAMVTVNGLSPIDVSVKIITSGGMVLGQSSYSLTCGAVTSVTGTAYSSITYQWTKDNGNQTIQVGTDRVLSFSPLRLSDAGRYACQATVNPCSLTKIDTQNVTLQISTPSSLLLTSSHSNIVTIGTGITLTCTLMLNSAIVASDISLLMVDAQLSRDRTPLTLTGPTVTGTTFTYTTQINSFGRTDSGNYICTATVRPKPSQMYIVNHAGNEMLSSAINIRGSFPPVNVRATQSGSSAPVEVSWSPPSGGANGITGYRIYYGNGQNVFVTSVTVITSVNLKVDRNYVGQNVSIRSEADQLYYSEFINVSVIDNTATLSHSCTNEVGTAVGTIIVLECLIVTVITVIIIVYLWRKKSSSKNKFTVSANKAYGEVTWKSVADPGAGGDGGECENPDRILRTGACTYESTPSSLQEAPVYASMEDIDAVGTIKTN